MWWVQMYFVLIELGFNIPAFLPSYNNLEMFAWLDFGVGFLIQQLKILLHKKKRFINSLD